MKELLITCEGEYEGNRAVFRFKLLNNIIKYVRVSTCDSIFEYGIKDYFKTNEVDNWASDNSIKKKIDYPKLDDEINNVLRMYKENSSEPYYIAYFKDEDNIKAAFGHMEKYDTLSDSFKVPDNIKEVYNKDYNAIKDIVKGYNKVLSR